MTLKHHKLLYIFMGWITLSCFLSPWQAQAVYGFHMRYEGLLSYVTCFILAITYWKYCDSVRTIILPILILSILYPVLMHYYGEDVVNWLMVPPMAIAAMCAIAFAFTYPLSKGFAAVIAICGLWTQIRSFLVVMLLVILIVEGYAMWRKGFSKRFIVTLCLIMSGTLFFIPKGFKEKISHTRVSTHGARAQWIQQTVSLTSSLPLTGFGLDTGSEWLKAAKGNMVDWDWERNQPKVSDRTHNIFCDILLWTGFIGLIVFLYILYEIGLYIWKYRGEENIACGLGILGYLVFGCINPLGCPALALLFICILGVKKP